MSGEVKHLSAWMRAGFLAGVSSGATVLISYAVSECVGRSDVFWTAAFDYELHFISFAVALVYFVVRSRKNRPQKHASDRQ